MVALLLDLLRLALTLAMLIHASVKDLKTREIEPGLWALYGVPLTVVSLLQLIHDQPSSLLIKTYMLSVIFAIALTLPPFLANMLGGADLFALIVVALSHPTLPFRPHLIFPASLLVLLYTLVCSLMFPISFFIYNLSMRNYKLLRQISLVKKIALMFLAIPLKASEIENKRFWYPLQRPWSGELKLSFSVEEDDAELRSKVREMVRLGLLRPDEPLWSTYGIPTIPFILVGYVMSLIAGDSFVKLILNIPS